MFKALDFSVLGEPSLLLGKKRGGGIDLRLTWIGVNWQDAELEGCRTGRGGVWLHREPFLTLLGESTYLPVTPPGGVSGGRRMVNISIWFTLGAGVTGQEAELKGEVYGCTKNPSSPC